MNYEKINKHTRDIYHAQHERMVNNREIMNEHISYLSEEFFRLEKDFFKNKRILDAGCGSHARNTIGFYFFGCRDLFAMDIGEEWKQVAIKNFENYDMDTKYVQVVSGNVVDLPFNNEEFDFVCFDGVIPHLPGKQVEKALSEMARVTKKGGSLFTSYLCEDGGLVNVIAEAVRRFYRENKDFAKIIDNNNPEIFESLFRFIVEKTELHTGEKIDIRPLLELYDEDLWISVQNLLQCKKRTHFTQEYIDNLLENNGFEKPRRLKRFVKRKNVRKYFAPFHYYSDYKYSKILYNKGYIDCITKRIK